MAPPKAGDACGNKTKAGNMKYLYRRKSGTKKKKATLKCGSSKQIAAWNKRTK